MRRLALGLLLGGLLTGGVLLAGPVWGFSDGIAGSSGQIEEHLRTCKGVQYCTVKPSYCGGCHGAYDDMWKQEGAEPTPQERVSQLTFKLNGDENAGLPDGLWEYTPGQTFSIEIQLANERPPGQYARGGFNLNASAGPITKWTPGDETVRITGGLFQHAGTQNPNVPMTQGQRYGATQSDETRFAGEATHTAQGSDVRRWQVKWTAPRSTPPRGVALVMTAMLPNGDGIDNCTHRQCNTTLGYESQSAWDWYGFMVPRRILCERGAYASFKECSDAVYKHILPPAPPVNTCGPDNPCDPNATEETDGGDAAAPAPLVILFVLAAVLLARRRRH